MQVYKAFRDNRYGQVQWIKSSILQIKEWKKWGKLVNVERYK